MLRGPKAGGEVVLDEEAEFFLKACDLPQGCPVGGVVVVYRDEIPHESIL